MTRSPRDRLTDIVLAIDAIQCSASGLDAIALRNAESVRDAVSFRFAVIGEAARHLPTEIQALAPDVPWSEIRATRHYVVHGYWQIDYEVIARAIERDLDPLKVAVTACWT
jgi:uncharacterized protein with HEPN domain